MAFFSEAGMCRKYIWIGRSCAAVSDFRPSSHKCSTPSLDAPPPPSPEMSSLEGVTAGQLPVD